MEHIRILFFKAVYHLAILFRGEWIWCALRDLNKSQYFSETGLINIQLYRLNKILLAAKTSDYYKDKIGEGVLNNIQELEKLPFLEKEDLRSHAENLITTRNYYQLTTKTSGGSTGAPVTLKKPAHAVGHELAAAWRGYSWAGIEIGHLQARFWGVPMSKKHKAKSQLIDLVTRRIRFSAFKFGKNQLDNYLFELNRKKDFYCYGYVSMIKEMAIHILSKNIPQPQVKSIITTSEVLNASDREIIEKAFQCRVYNEYGCGEVGTIAHECEFGNMHINAENVYVEIVNEKGEILDRGMTGEIVVTDLNNDYMPLIRYRLRDFGSISIVRCKCKRTLPILENLRGRAYDFVLNEKGEKFHGEFFLYIIEEFKSKGFSVDGIQFISTRMKLEILIASSNEIFEKAKLYISLRLQQDFSSVIKPEYKKVDAIPREKSGKLRVIKSDNT